MTYDSKQCKDVTAMNDVHFTRTVKPTRRFALVYTRVYGQFKSYSLGICISIMKNV